MRSFSWILLGVCLSVNSPAFSQSASEPVEDVDETEDAFKTRSEAIQHGTLELGFDHAGEIRPRNHISLRRARQAEADGDSKPVEKGFFIIEQAPVDPPYIVSRRNGVQSINGHVLPQGEVDWTDLRGLLETNDIVWIRDGQRENFGRATGEGTAILAMLSSMNKNTASMRTATLLPKSELLPDILALETTPLVAKKASGVLTELEIRNANDVRMSNALLRIEELAYPLTMAGMIVTVIAFGHLLSSSPEPGTGVTGQNSAPIAKMMVIRSIVFVVLLSSLDLIWTIMASQSGQMRELNPIASRYINNPTDLIAFKGLATLVGAALLIALRQYRQAQIASWWMCLVCTVLAFRWLTFHSMMTG